MKLLLLALMVLLGIGGLSAAILENKDAYEDHFKTEMKTADGRTVGEYGYRTPDGCLHVVKYESGQKGGYRVLGSSKRDCIRPKARRPQAATPNTTTKRPLTIAPTKKAVVFTPTRRPTTTTAARRIPTTTTTTSTTTRPTIRTTTPKPRDPLTVRPIPQINNTIEDHSFGRQLIQPVAQLTTSKPNADEPAYSYGYTTPTHGHTEKGGPNGSKKGEYWWDSPDGNWRFTVTYEANERGFFPRVVRTRLTPFNPKPNGGSDPAGDPIAKELAGPDTPEEIALPVGGCPYYFYYNTRINYHWERCHEDGNKTGEFGLLASDGYSHKTSYYADNTGFHPKLSKTLLTARQVDIVAEHTNGTFIIPKPDEERVETEKRILEWIDQNREKIDEPLR